MPATFRCVQSGQTVTFTLQHDIDSMKGHSGYVRVDEEGVEELAHTDEVRTDTAFSAPMPPKRPGRPRKQANV
jgi:hypothetical protein